MTLISFDKSSSLLYSSLAASRSWNKLERFQEVVISLRFIASGSFSGDEENPEPLITSTEKTTSAEIINPSAESIYIITPDEQNQIMSLDIYSWSPIA